MAQNSCFGGKITQKKTLIATLLRLFSRKTGIKAFFLAPREGESVK